MSLSFLEPARDEFRDAIAYYESQRSGLGDEFVQEVKRTVQRVLLDPESYERISEHVHRCSTRRFPYAVLYSVEPDDSIVIVAVMHLHREPDYWQDRL